MTRQSGIRSLQAGHSCVRHVAVMLACLKHKRLGQTGALGHSKVHLGWSENSGTPKDPLVNHHFPH